jgi:hypothetical protein
MSGDAFHNDLCRLLRSYFPKGDIEVEYGGEDDEMLSIGILLKPAPCVAAKGQDVHAAN